MPPPPHLPVLLLPALLLQAPAPPSPVVVLVPAALFVLGGLLTWFWKVYDATKATEKAEGLAVADLKQKQQSDILKIEGTLGIIVTTIDRLAGTTEMMATVTERVAGQKQQIAEIRQEIAALRDTLTPQVAQLKSDLKHLRNA